MGVLDFGAILCNHIYNHIQYHIEYHGGSPWWTTAASIRPWSTLRAMPAGCSGTWCLDERPDSLVRLTQNKKEGRIHFGSYSWNIQWKPIRHLVCWILQSASNLRHLPAMFNKVMKGALGVELCRCDRPGNHWADLRLSPYTTILRSFFLRATMIITGNYRGYERTYHSKQWQCELI